MKCSKCNEECKENQAFCLKCGNPLQVVPDFNLIEAELASNIGELMDEIDSESKKESDMPKEVEYDDMEIKLVDISRNKEDNRKEEIEDLEDLEDFEEEEIEADAEEDDDDDDYEDEEKEPVNKKKIAIIIGSTVVALALAVALFLKFASSVEKTTTSSSDFYAKAEEAYNNNDLSDAIKYATDARDKANDDEETLKAATFLHELYLADNETGEEYAKNLEIIINAKTEESTYYVALAEYYDENEMIGELTSLMMGIDDEKLLSKLEKYVVLPPVADKESGEYNEFFAVNFTVPEGSTIYYTTDSRNPSNYGETYIDAIPVTKEGETIIKVIAVNEKGVESKVATFTYNVKLTGENAPTVIPSGGQYSEYTKIKIEVPEGAKAYYTWDNSEPTKDSTLYTEEIDMLRGINILKVIIIDKYGIASEVTQQSYNLQIPPQITINEACTLVKEKALETSSEGDVAEASYETIINIENDEYYIITVSVKDSANADKSLTFYAVNTYDKSIQIAVDMDGEYILQKQMEN